MLFLKKTKKPKLSPPISSEYLIEEIENSNVSAQRKKSLILIVEIYEDMNAIEVLKSLLSPEKDTLYKMSRLTFKQSSIILDFSYLVKNTKRDLSISRKKRVQND